MCFIGRWPSSWIGAIDCRPGLVVSNSTSSFNAARSGRKYDRDCGSNPWEGVFMAKLVIDRAVERDVD